MNPMYAYRRLALAVLFLLSAGVLSAAPFIGMIAVPFREIFSNSPASSIFWDIRVPRVLMAYVAGAALAISGAAFQAMFRNPLATPFTLGVAHGAVLGSAVYLWLGLSFEFFWFSGVSFFGFLGAVAAIAVVYGLTRLKKGFSVSTILLAGVAVSFFFSSLVLFIQYVSDFSKSLHIMRWMMGGLESAGYHSVLDVAPLVLVGSASILFFSKELNLLVSGEEIAASRGVDLLRSKVVLFLSASLMVGGVVSACGPIGFIGLIVPHLCRFIFGYDHRFLLPAVLLAGGAFLAICDTLSRTLIAPAEMPVGIITALLGGPFFLWLLFRR